MAFKDQFEEKSLHWVQLPSCYFILITLCLETYLLLDGCPSQDDDSHLAACVR